MPEYPISIFIVTSYRDYDQVNNFLEKKNNFFYDNLYVCHQNDLAVVDQRGKMVFKDKTSVVKCPNGSGGVFKTILKYNLSK
jgi:putative uridylyltransferase